MTTFTFELRRRNTFINRHVGWIFNYTRFVVVRVREPLHIYTRRPREGVRVRRDFIRQRRRLCAPASGTRWKFPDAGEPCARTRRRDGQLHLCIGGEWREVCVCVCVCVWRCRRWGSRSSGNVLTGGAGERNARAHTYAAVHVAWSGAVAATGFLMVRLGSRISVLPRTGCVRVCRVVVVVWSFRRIFVLPPFSVS